MGTYHVLQTRFILVSENAVEYVTIQLVSVISNAAKWLSSLLLSP